MSGNLDFDYSDGNLYANIKVGADTVRKKLGSEIKNTGYISKSIAPGSYSDFTVPEKSVAIVAYAIQNTAIQGCLIILGDGSTKLYGYRCPIQKISSTVARITPVNDTFSQTLTFNLMSIYID